MRANINKFAADVDDKNQTIHWAQKAIYHSYKTIFSQSWSNFTFRKNQYYKFLPSEN